MQNQEQIDGKVVQDNAEAYIERDDDAGGVIGRKLDGGAEEAVQI